MVQAAISADASTGASTGDLTLSVYNARDERVFERSYGNFGPNERVAIASASKLVSGMLLLDVVARGELSLESTTGEVLGWTGPQASITLRQLLSFTSGMQAENLCAFNPLISLATCVNSIAGAPLAAAPATRFDYGSTHLAVAGRMAEVATGRGWNALFRERIADPLGLPSGVLYYALPAQAVGASNPLVAGGLQASARDYARMLALAYHRGEFAGVTIGTAALFDAQSREPFPAVVVGNSPSANLGSPFRYGLSAWLECSTPATGCDRVSSAGAFGFTPWLDRGAGYYATLSMERFDGRATRFSVLLQQTLLPFIEVAINTPQGRRQ